MLFTRMKMPVSTSFLLLGLFANKAQAFYSVIWKSLEGYLITWAIAFVFYGVI